MNSILKKYYIELPKFRKENPDMNDKLNQWLAFHILNPNKVISNKDKTETIQSK